jgi:hypothetical protein
MESEVYKLWHAANLCEANCLGEIWTMEFEAESDLIHRGSKLPV